MEDITPKNKEIEIESLVIQLTDNFSKILSINEIKLYPKLYWGGNGVGDRWANKKFNYSVIYSKKQPRKYSENDDDTIPEELLKEFLAVNKGTGIIGIFVFSKRTNNQNRPIRADIKNKYKNQ
jgi:hypothetical protein